jgi:hypothetical protein
MEFQLKNGKNSIESPSDKSYSIELAIKTAVFAQDRRCGNSDLATIQQCTFYPTYCIQRTVKSESDRQHKIMLGSITLAQTCFLI